MKVCSKCKINKEDCCFNKTKNNSRGLTSWCKSCIRNYDLSKNYPPIYEGTKECQTCGKELSCSDFHVNKRSQDGLEQRCKVCSKLRKQKNDYKRKYNITVDDYESMLMKQQYVCAICCTPLPGTRISKFHVDHDHKTGEVRGLLCENCNRALGGFKDNADLLRKAAEYLDEAIK